VNSRLYHAQVVHARFAPVPHRFHYPFYTFAFDLDELPDLDRAVTGFGYNRPALLTLRDRDYLRGAGSLREKLMRFLRDAGCADEVARIELLTVPHCLGRVFNPVSFYYVYRADRSIRCVVAEVNNTFGERHLYILRPDAAAPGFPLKFRHPKQFHVSPFNDRRGHYEFKLSELGPQLRIVITLVRDDRKILTAILRGESVPLTSRTLLGAVARHPFRIIAAFPRILAQAVRLKFRRHLPVYTKPPPLHPLTIQIPPPTPFQRLGRAGAHRLLTRLRIGRLEADLPNGERWSFGDPAAGASAALRVWDYRFFTRLALDGDVGFGESYTAAEWDTPDLAGLLTLLVRNLPALDGGENRRLGWITRPARRLLHAARRNTRRGSRANIQAHYDLGNDFYRLWLDPETLAYSCAYFERPDQSLADAQRAKMRRMIELAGLQPGHHLLEIGCGWGGFAIEAVRRTGCRVTGLTLSPAQLELARERVRQAGLSDHIELHLLDYRDIQGAYDRIVSIEMLEAVGHEYLGLFFNRCAELLRPGGRLAIQVITIPDERYEAYRTDPDWIQKHIFPGGLLPCRRALEAAWTAHSPLTLRSCDDIGLHYAPTLRAWRAAFNAQSEALTRLGFDAAFQRTWNYYFAYCEAGFATRYIHDLQFVLEKH